MKIENQESGMCQKGQNEPKSGMNTGKLKNDVQ